MLYMQLSVCTIKHIPTFCLHAERVGCLVYMRDGDLLHWFWSTRAFPGSSALRCKNTNLYGIGPRQIHLRNCSVISGSIQSFCRLTALIYESEGDLNLSFQIWAPIFCISWPLASSWLAVAPLQFEMFHITVWPELQNTWEEVQISFKANWAINSLTNRVKSILWYGQYTIIPRFVSNGHLTASSSFPALPPVRLTTLVLDL